MFNEFKAFLHCVNFSNTFILQIKLQVVLIDCYQGSQLVLSIYVLSIATNSSTSMTEKYTNFYGTNINIKKWI